MAVVHRVEILGATDREVPHEIELALVRQMLEFEGLLDQEQATRIVRSLRAYLMSYGQEVHVGKLIHQLGPIRRLLGLGVPFSAGNRDGTANTLYYIGSATAPLGEVESMRKSMTEFYPSLIDLRVNQALPPDPQYPRLY
ncbi:hypothetical protein M8A51_23020 [Schlegelella sp. S2-27]|uniref:Uncharacterized protein n=1 Tax=Caldimonas mangrovi TaxID=2944811 RepID=A0ABT0YUI6_9BURK|nr:hypothetical protein [Caldimonas mangrovi]MCM5682410.1 hypothetical protein [Caldimonas mangrovi]